MIMLMQLSLFLALSFLSRLSANLQHDNHLIHDHHPLIDYYELLHVSEFRHNVVTRQSRLNIPWTRQIHFYAHGRSFSVHMEPRLDLLSPRFSVHLVDSNGAHQPYSHDTTNRYYQGHLIGDNSSSVVVSLSPEDNSIIAEINVNNDTYFIEPAHFHFDGQSLHNHAIIYRKSDTSLKPTNISTRIDYVIAPDPYHKVQVNQKESVTVLKKRRNNIQDSCSVVVVADYRFYNFLRSSESNVIDTIVSRIDAADRLSFRNAEWIVNANQDTVTGLGLQIESIIIHTEPSSDTTHYNTIDNDLTIHEILKRFSRNNWSGYCLAHLMTHRSFPSSKLGLAYIASPEVDKTGGICSTRVLDAESSDIVTYNTGVSIVSSGDRLLLPSEAELVIAHEIGHSWGSSHDPGNNVNCAFDYLMNDFAQDDSNPKHRVFSPCSRVSIGRVLVNKAKCFETRSQSSCGNFKIDEGEECDEGRIDSSVTDGHESCCTSDCRLRDTKECSDVNHPCCVDCTIAPVGSKVCHVAGNVSRDCTALTTCNGLSKYCPEPNQAKVGSPCIDGVCMFKDDSNSTLECVSYCDIEGLDTCSCTDSDSQCLECCVIDDVCQPLLYRGDTVAFPDGVFCSRGFCSSGICVDSGQDFASQLWSVISTLDINKYAQFTQENIVGFILVVVTVFWVPGSCLCYCLCDVLKLWKRLKRHSSEGPDDDSGWRYGGGSLGPAFVTQNSWTKGKPELMPLLSVEEEAPVDEPEDDTPLPVGFTNYNDTTTNVKIT